MMGMTEKRFTTVELPKPNKWGIWYDGAYLSTYQVCTLLNEYVDVRKENDMLSCELSVSANKEISRNCRIAELEKENEQLKKDNNELENEIEKLENRLWNCQNVR